MPQALDRDEKFIRATQFAIAKFILPRIKAACGSRTLKEALQFFERDDGVCVIQVPHYWAAYFNDGHGSFGPKNAQFLVFFREPLRDDPRLKGQFPIRYDEWRPLTKEEFNEAATFNVILGGTRLVGPYMVAVRRVRGKPGDHFFEKGFQGCLAAGAEDLIIDGFDSHVKATLPRNTEDKINAKLKVTAKFSFL